MPFMSYQAGLHAALANAGRMMKEGGFESVKLEGGREIAETIYRMVRMGIPVVAHVGLMPQRVHAMGGFKVQGRTGDGAESILEDAIAIADAGAFALVIEGVPAPLAERITHAVEIPTIGIGAGVACDGQILVSYDLLGLNDTMKPKFVKRYEEFFQRGTDAAKQYVDEVRSGVFPAPEHSFGLGAPTPGGRPRGGGRPPHRRDPLPRDRGARVWPAHRGDPRAARTSAALRAGAPRRAPRGLRPHHGRPPRGPPHARPRGPSTRRGRRRGGRCRSSSTRPSSAPMKTSPATPASSTPTSAAAPRPASTWSSRPSVEAMYPPGDQTRVRVTKVAEPLCGPFRPGHFEGVATIVSKLFALAGACDAVFGRKDYQQWRVLDRMARDLFLPVEVVGHPTVREADGLAMSSRNRYLSVEDRLRARVVPEALSAAVRAYEGGERDVATLRSIAQAILCERADKVEYADLREPVDLDELPNALAADGRAVLAVAVRIGATRLIDNVVLGEEGAPRPS